MGIVSTDRILKLLDSDDYTENNGTYEPETVRGKVEFKNVWFAYNDDEYVLKDINFHMNEGETIAFVGPSGAGKSTLVDILIGLLNPSPGYRCGKIVDY